VQFKILGPIEVTSGDTQARIPPGRQPIILSALLLEPNRVVSIDRLIDVVWDEQPPATARSQVQICVSALRHVFTELGVDAPIVTRAPGYLLKVADSQIDSQNFARLVSEANAAERDGALEEAVELLRTALALWRGRALGGEPGPGLLSAAVRLEEARLTATETWIDLELRLGRQHRVTGELGSLVAEHPLRERLRGQLMIALYRSGRPAEALEVYRAGWRLLVDELGLEPSEELRKLEAAILAEDPRLQPDASEVSAQPARSQVPRQLPADIVDFTGREALVEQAEAALLDGDDRAAVRVVVLAGKAGIGKTALAMHVAHQVAERRFPDGQLFCGLAGMQRTPIDPSDVLGRFLRALGMPGSSIPDSLDERAEMYRSLLAGRKLLVVLDDVAAVRQVLPLLPGSGSCAVILTSRVRLTEISGAKVLDVDLFQPEKALDLLGKVIGEQRVAGESTAAAALVRMVGGLPLALRIVAARLSARPHWSLASMVGRLADERRRLDELAHGDLMMRASLQLTYDGLETREARLFRLLGALPEGSIPGWIAAALLDEEPIEASGLLERLVDTQMLDVTGPDLDGEPRYGLHAIIRLFARERLTAEAQQVRDEAVARVLGGWLAMADQMHREIYGGDFSVLQGTARRWEASGPRIGLEPVDPLRWLEAESPNLVAAVGLAAAEGHDELCWELAVRLNTLFSLGGYFDEWQQSNDRALQAVRKAGNKRGEAAILTSFGHLHLARRQLAPARAVLEPAMRLFVEAGDLRGQAMAGRALANLDHHRGETDRARSGYFEALEGFRRVGDLACQAHVLSNIASISSEWGDHELATDQLNEALEICRDVGCRRIEAQVLYRLGEVLLRQQRNDEADLVLSSDLELIRASRDTIGEAYVLHALGRARARLGRRAEAEELLRKAISLREQIMDNVGASRVQQDLAPLLAKRVEPVAAVGSERVPT
jgi:DNA-binding SARP family transcriptional activator